MWNYESYVEYVLQCPLLHSVVVSRSKRERRRSYGNGTDDVMCEALLLSTIDIRVDVDDRHCLSHLAVFGYGYWAMLCGLCLPDSLSLLTKPGRAHRHTRHPTPSPVKSRLLRRCHSVSVKQAWQACAVRTRRRRCEERNSFSSGARKTDLKLG